MAIHPPLVLKSKSSHIPPRTVGKPRTLSVTGCAMYIAMWIAFIHYALWRVYTASASTLSLVILAAEALAALRVAVYGLYIMYNTRVYNNAALNTPAACNLRIMVPCLNESLEIVRETVLAAAATEMPAGCCKFIYMYVQYYLSCCAEFYATISTDAMTARTLPRGHGSRSSWAARFKASPCLT